jgi:hypothetical protein
MPVSSNFTRYPPAVSEDAQLRHPRLSPPPRPARGRLVVVLAACAAVAMLGTSILNRSRWTLQCEDGRLVAYRGLSLPIGESRLDPDAYPPIHVLPAACEDIVASSREELEEHYVAATMHRIDSARSADASGLESAAQVAEQLVDAADVGNDVLDERKRELVVALLRADLRAANTALQRARARLRAAADAGVSEEVLRTLQAEVDALGTLPALEEPTTQPEPATKEPERATQSHHDHAPPGLVEAQEGSRAL